MDVFQSIPGVETAYFDEPRNCVCIVCAPGAPIDQIRVAVATEVSRLGDRAPAIEVLVRPESAARQRVRFENVEVIAQPDRRVRVRVLLEWNGRIHVGEAEGEPGETIELRTAIDAGLRAIEDMTGVPLGLRLVGVKRVRAFDAELMVVSLYRPGPKAEKLVGSVLAGDKPHRAAAIALLNALNRLLGNYLITG